MEQPYIHSRLETAEYRGHMAANIDMDGKAHILRLFLDSCRLAHDGSRRLVPASTHHRDRLRCGFDRDHIIVADRITNQIFVQKIGRAEEGSVGKERGKKCRTRG